MGTEVIRMTKEMKMMINALVEEMGSMEERIYKRFDAVDVRFDKMERRLDSMQHEINALFLCFSEYRCNHIFSKFLIK